MKLPFVKNYQTSRDYKPNVDDNLNLVVKNIENSPLRNKIIGLKPLSSLAKTNINNILQGYNLTVFVKALILMREQGYCVLYVSKSANKQWVLNIISNPTITPQDEDLVVKDAKGVLLNNKYVYTLGSFHYPEMYKAINSVGDEEVINRYNRLLCESEAKINEFSVIYIKDELLSSVQAQNTNGTFVKNYMEHSAKVRDNIKNKGLVVIGGSSEINYLTPDLAPAVTLFDNIYKDISMAFSIPFTKLFGESATGLNATGEGDRLNWYDQLEEFYKVTIKPFIDFYNKIVNNKVELIFTKSANELKMEAEARGLQLQNIQTLLANDLISKDEAKLLLQEYKIIKGDKWKK